MPLLGKKYKYYLRKLLLYWVYWCNHLYDCFFVSIDESHPWGIPWWLQPDQYCSDEAGSVLGCGSSRLSYLSHHLSAPWQCPSAGSGGQWTTELNTTRSSHVSHRMQFIHMHNVITLLSCWFLRWYSGYIFCGCAQNCVQNGNFHNLQKIIMVFGKHCQIKTPANLCNHPMTLSIHD